MLFLRRSLAALLILLFLAVLFLWIDSYAVTRSFTLTDYSILYSNRGSLWCTHNSRGGLIKAGPLEHGEKISQLLQNEPNALDFKLIRRPPLTLFIIPCWSLQVLTFIPLLLFPWRSLARRLRYGRCPNCNYDLRASPRRCPECGTPIARDGSAA